MRLNYRSEGQEQNSSEKHLKGFYSKVFQTTSIISHYCFDGESFSSTNLIILVHLLTKCIIMILRYASSMWKYFIHRSIKMCCPLDSAIKIDNGKPKEKPGFTGSKTLSLMIIWKKRKIIQVIYKNVRSSITECSLLLLFLKSWSFWQTYTDYF